MFLQLAKHQRIIASFLLINFLTFFVPIQSKALSSGPSQPETQQFAPAGMDDMVDPFTGDFSYNIPLMDVGGYPINLNYASGITPDAEATWVGLGWNLNVGAINRSVRGLPDDFAGDEVTTDYNVKPNQTYGAKVSVGLEAFGAKTKAIKVNLGVTANIFYNTYNGMGISLGVNPSLSSGRSSDNKYTANLGASLSAGSESGVDITPTVGLSPQEKNNEKQQGLTASIGFPFNTREGLKGMTLSGNGQLNEKGRSYSNHIYQGFSTPTYTPSIQQSHKSFSFATGVSLSGSIPVLEVGNLGLDGYYNGQFLAATKTQNPAYGYMYSGVDDSDTKLYDINREKEGGYHKKFTKNLGLTNYTYDIFQVSGQGISGAYRLHRGDIGTVADPAATDVGIDYTTNLSIGFGGTTTDIGFGGALTRTSSEAGKWSSDNRYMNRFDSENDITNPQSEKVYFKKIGEASIENDLFQQDVQMSTKLLQYGLESKIFGIAANTYDSGEEVNEASRTTRPNKTTAFTTLTANEAVNGNVLPIQNYKINSFDWRQRTASLRKPSTTNENIGYEKSTIIRNSGVKKGHHISEVRVTDQSGARYVYGIPAYNHIQKEITFAVKTNLETSTTENGIPNDIRKTIIKSGLVPYDPAEDLGNSNDNGLDNYYNCVTTPANAHSYLLTCILSSDYVDSDNILGPSSGDLGTYTKFNYAKLESNYKWRTPMSEEMDIASFSEGMTGTHLDDKGNIVYGEKEVWYLHSIETPTHIAEFYLSNRMDGFGAQGIHGGIGDVALKKLDKIVLYSKADKLNSSGEPIKTVHFGYSYDLCPSTVNSTAPATTANPTGKGKLTLKKIWFTYGKSEKGVLNPYVFTYADQNFDGTIDNGTTNGTANLNPNYSHLNYDRWGNYKLNNTDAPNAAFPYTAQNNQQVVDNNMAVYTLSTIQTPTGGSMHVVYESDDYAYVQNKKAMRMFRIDGGDDAIDIGITGLNPFNPSVTINLEEGFIPKTEDKDKEFQDLYIGDVSLMYFKAYMNVVAAQNVLNPTGRYEYVPGYVEIDKANSKPADPVGGVYKKAIIKLKPVQAGLSPNVNPISRAGWIYAKMNLNRELKGLGTAETAGADDILFALVAQANSMVSFVTGFTGEMIVKQNSGKLIPNKSFVKLQEPDQKKLGGGHRVKAIVMSDNWGRMISAKEGTLGLSEKQTAYYGQKYEYTTTENGHVISSGVAAYEPILGGEENPFRRPVFVVEKVPLAVDNEYFQEEPFGECFFPSPTVGYSKVVVTPLKITAANFADKEFNGNGTGKVEQEFYTAKDFPTYTERTDIKKSNLNPGLIAKFMKLGSFDIATCTQGYYIETNDMHGKPKSKRVYAEAAAVNSVPNPQPISEVEYRYKTANGYLDNKVTTISPNLNIPAAKSTLGVDVDMVNDQREFQTVTLGGGADINLKITVIPPALISIVPTGFPDVTDEFVQFRSVVTTKVVNKSGILEETIARDNGASITTKNLAWDAKTGEIILTSLQNEFHDPIYTFNYPAHWAYSRMSLASETEGMRFTKTYFDSNPGKFQDGDELLLDNTIKAFVNKNKTNNTLQVLNKKGIPITSFNTGKVIRSGARNMAAAPIGTVVMLSNPMQDNSIVFANVINAGASEYKEEWKRIGCDCDGDGEDAPGSNPYVLGLKGNLRPYKSWTYLTNRYQRLVNNQMNIRTDGFYKDFAAFWEYHSGTLKPAADLNTASNKWQYVTEITNYNPLGLEIENKDALSRYLMAQYGYNRKLPVATSNNSQYRESGFDGFEDYDYNDCMDDHFSWRKVEGVPITPSDEQAHTGRKSIKVPPAQSYEINKVITPCE